MTERLRGKVAIVTGGATGIGEAISHKFAKEGATVVVAGMADDPVDDVVTAIKKQGFEAIAFKGDLADEQLARACVETTVERFGKLDVLVNNAGVFPVQAVTEDHPVDAFEDLIRNNIRSAFLMTKFSLKHLQKSKGCVLSAGSEAGLNGLAHMTVYGGTKAWMHAFMQGVAVEQAKYGVRANCVCFDAAGTTGHAGRGSQRLRVSGVG
jgi:NAD(P)-dependent dehydrogenase (short-subunit alcohol dehydrogenase family)